MKPRDERWQRADFRAHGEGSGEAKEVEIASGELTQGSEAPAQKGARRERLGDEECSHVLSDHGARSFVSKLPNDESSLPVFCSPL